ncbi:hypothetical protein LAZ67_15002377, partial [Cordylochernes scorpioides]
MPERPSVQSQPGDNISPKERIEKNSSKEFSMEFQRNADPPARETHASPAAARDDVTPSLAASLSYNSAARAPGNWADCAEDLRPGTEDGFTVVKSRKRRRESAGSPTAVAPSSNAGGARSSRRLQSSARSVPRAQEIPTTRAHIAEARARQASSAEKHCVYLEHGPELQPFHYMRALDRLLGGTAGVIQIFKVNGHQLLGLANRGLAERLINDGLEVEGTLLRAFPFRKRAERITVGNLPFFVEDSAIINALRPYGRITSIAPKMMKAGPYIYNDGRREAFIVLHEGVTTERLPTRLDTTIKGEAWPAYLSSGIKCSRCHGQGHRRANCPLLAGRANNTGLAPPTSPAGVPPPTTPAPPQRSAAQPPAPAPSGPAMEIPGASPAARAAIPSTSPRPSPPVAPAVPMEMAPPAPPPVTPAPSPQAPEGHVPAAPTPDVEMSIIEETSISSTFSTRTSTRVGLVAFIEGNLRLLCRDGRPWSRAGGGPGPPLLKDQGSPKATLADTSTEQRSRRPHQPDFGPEAERNFQCLQDPGTDYIRNGVSLAETDALGLGREEVLDILSSKTKAHKRGQHLTPPQSNALAGLINQILDLRPGGNSNIYKVLRQVLSELRTGQAAVPPTSTLPAPRPFHPTPLTSHKKTLTPAMITPPATQMGEVVPMTEVERCVPPLPAPQPAEPAPPAPQESTPATTTPPLPPPAPMEDDVDLMPELDTIFNEMITDPGFEPLLEPGISLDAVMFAVLYREDRLDLLGDLSPEQGNRAATRRASSAYFASGECMDPGGTPSMIRAESPSKAEKKPVRHGAQALPCAEIPAKQDLQSKTFNASSINRMYANPPSGDWNANLAAARGDVTTGSAAATSSNGAARVLGNWADYTEDQGPGENDDFTVVKNKKRRRESPVSPAAAAPSSGTRGAGATRRPRSSTGWAPRAEEVRTTRAHIAEARARQASSTEDHCVFVERSPELEPYHYLRAIDRMFGSTREVFQVTKMNGHFLVGLANRGMAERLVNEGLEVEGTLHRAFPFRKRAERITVGNLPFFVGDAAVISALSSFGRVTSIAPKLMKAGPYVYNDGRREAFIILREGMTIERLPTRLDISIKGEAWPAYLSSGIRCSRCRGQGHRRANCPLLAGLTNAPGPATPTSPTSVPSATAPGLPQQPSAQPPTSASPSPTLELSDVPPASRAALLPPAAPRPPPPAPLALPVEDTSPAPPPVIPAPSLRAPGGSVSPQSSKSEPSARDIEMTAIDESSASSTSSSRTSMRDDLVAFIRRSPTVSFTGTDALGLGREEVLDLLSSRTKAQRKRSLLTPPQTDALAGLIKQILDLKPAGNTNVYKLLHQVKSELKKGPAAVPPTPPLPAPRPAGPTPPVPHGVETKPAMATPPPPLPTPMEEEHVDHEDLMEDLFDELNSNTELKPLLDSGFSTPSKAEKKPVRLGFQAQLCADLSAKENIQKNISISSDEFQKYVNPPAGGQHANPAAPTNFDTASFSEAAAQANRSWADLAEDNNPEHEDNYTTVQRKKRRRGSAESPAAAAPSSNIRGAGAIRRPRSSTGWAPRAEEIRTTRAHIAEARARQASSTEDHCVYVERSPELEPFHYMRAIERMFGSTREVFQVTKMNGHFLVGLANRGMAERLVNEGLEVEGTLHRAFPFRKRAERITVGNLPFFVGDATVISALSAFGRVTSIAPKLMKAGPYIYNDGRREAFIILREGMTIEGLPTRLNITIKGEAWPAYLSSGIRCSRCRGQGHRRANCPLLAGRTNAPGPATPTSPTSVPSATAPGLPQQPSAQPPPSASPSPTMELSDVPPASRAALLPPAAPRPPPPAPLALPVEETSPAPPPVIPAPSLRAPGGSVSPQSTKSEPSARDIEMTAIEESSASSTSSSRTSMRDDLVAFIRRSPTVSFTGTDALGLGR